MDTEEQLLMWVTGNSVHDDENGRHVPDYSCCNPVLKAPSALRLRYYQAVLENDVALCAVIEQHFAVAMAASFNIKLHTCIEDVHPVMH